MKFRRKKQIKFGPPTRIGSFVTKFYWSLKSLQRKLSASKWMRKFVLDKELKMRLRKLSVRTVLIIVV